MSTALFAISLSAHPPQSGIDTIDVRDVDTSIGTRYYWDMTIYAALDAVGLTVADIASIRATVLSAIKAANADLVSSFGGRS